MPGIHIKISSSLSHEQALALEWLETNGCGGYSSSTVLNCHTRRYHGLFVANLKEPAGRHVLLSKFEDSFRSKGREYFLSCHQYPGLFFPEDDQLPLSFQFNGCPCFTFRSGKLMVHKSVMLLQGQDHLLLRYDIEKCPAPGLLRIRPFLACRGYHSLSRQNPFLHVHAAEIKNGLIVRPYEGLPPLYIQTNIKSRFYPYPVWYNNFEYDVERQRGYEDHEDLFQPGLLEVPVKEGSSVILSVSLQAFEKRLTGIWAREQHRRMEERKRIKSIAEKFENQEDRTNVENLIAAGSSFLIKTPSGRPAIIAGYHWFNDWGRDTLISLPGLTFCSGRPGDGMDILASLAEHENDGLLPNYFSDHSQEKSYNSVDATLWFYWAVQQALRHTGAMETIEKKFWPVMKKMIRRLMSGTAMNISMNNQGLLHAGHEVSNLTWMDATVAGKPVTPRWGYAVEINALWYNAICFVEELARHFGEDEFFFPELITGFRRAFQETFWIEEKGYLGDVFRDGRLDEALRPNQVLAVSLPYSPLDPGRWHSVVTHVRQHLLTPCGLRTLSPEDPRYIGRYGGDSAARDGAYHQGTVWPWLLAQFGEALLRAVADKDEARLFLLDLIRSFLRRHWTEAGIGCVSEVFDGDTPHRPNGCISQAWSVAELIRLYMILNEPLDGSK
jgi:predicted glycogen debranching enzyme